jgi:hypothetical protein
MSGLSKLGKQLRRTRLFRKEELRQQSTINDPLPQPSTELRIKMPEHGHRIAVIPDAQNQPGSPINHLTAAGNFIADKRPDVIVCGGDFGDFQSVNPHILPGTLEHENKRYQEDLDAVYAAMDALVTPFAKVPSYNPTMIFTLGNHEDMIPRYVQTHTEMQGRMKLADLRYVDYGWKVVPFLQPVVIGGVAFCHFFPFGALGKPITTARALLRELHMSAFAFHKQGRDIAFSKRADGQTLGAIIAGSFYQHDMSYLNPFTNKHWRGMYFLHEVHDGQFYEMALGVDYMVRRWGPLGVKTKRV